MIVQIADRTVGLDHRCFVIAEAGVNHNGDVRVAHELIDAAADGGADAVKFQLFSPDLLASPRAAKARYQIETTAPDESQLEMLKRLALDREEHETLAAHCRATGITYLLSVFDEQSINDAVSLEVPALKIPSGELTNHDLLRAAASTSLPLIVSTGMATMEEVAAAMEVVAGSSVALLHCVSSYPAPAREANLRAISALRDAFVVPVGFSDHTFGATVAVAAVALGAALVEKHLTQDKQSPGPDHAASLEPHEFQAMVSAIREVEESLGDGMKRPMPSETQVAEVARKSVVAARDIEAGSALVEADLAVRRPGTGLPPSLKETLIGRPVAVRIPAGTPIDPEMLS